MSIDTKEKKIVPESVPVKDGSPYIDTAYIGDPEDLMKEIKPRYDLFYSMLTLRLPYIYQSIAFYAGQQNTFWNAKTGSLSAMPVIDPMQSTAINNRILNKCLAMVQRLVSFDPTSQAVPASPSSGDVYSARVAKKVVESNHNDPKLKYKQEYRKQAEFVVICGQGWIRTEWDPFGGRQMVTYKQQPSFQQIVVEAQKEGEGAFAELGEWLGNPMEEIEENDGKNNQKTDEESGEIPDQTSKNAASSPDEAGSEPAGSGTDSSADESDTPETPQGEDQSQVKPVKKTFKIPALDPDTGKQKMEPVRDSKGKIQLDEIKFDGCVSKKAVSPLNILYNATINSWEEAFDCFEDEYLTIDEVRRKYPNCSDLTENDYETNSMNPWTGLLQIGLGKNPMGSTTGIRVTTYFCKSCESFPEGLIVIYIKDKVRVARAMPTYRGDCLPYDFAGFIHMPGTFWYLSLPYYLMAPQTILNKLLRQQIDHARQFAVPKIVVRNDTTFANVITDGVEVIRVSGGGPLPQFQNPQALSTAHMELIKYMDDCIDTNSGVSKTAEGNPPPNVTSAEMSEAITENDYQLHMLVIDEFAQNITSTCNKEIRCIQEHAAEEIITRFIGPGGKYYAKKFKKSNLRNLSDVIFIPGKAANLSRGQQRKDLNLILPIVTQGKGSPAQQEKIVDQAIKFGMWGEEEAFISYMEQDENNCLEIIAEIDANVFNPKYDPTKMIMPWCNMDVWKDVIESELKNYTEFNQKPEITKKRLINLWHAVTLTKERQMGNGAPSSGGAPQQPQPAGAPNGAPPMGAPGSTPPGAPPPPGGLPPQGGQPQPGVPQAPEMAGASQ